MKAISDFFRYLYTKYSFLNIFIFKDLIRSFYEKSGCSLESSVNSGEVVTKNVPRGKASAASFQISEDQFKKIFKFQKLSTLEMGKVRQPLK